MGNGITISKDAFLNVGGNDINTRRDAQREMLFDAVLSANNKIEDLSKDLKEQCPAQKDACNQQFASKSDVKWLTWGFRAVYTSLLISIVLTILKYSLELRSFGN